ncbi:MAG: hypothetical protein JWO05_3669 [Gemmatimonadetes bacterium]|nr:hypothetical protein [Gemmatimonadota bacterium]
MRIRRALALLLALLLVAAAACGGPDCIDESRGLNTSSVLAPLPNSASLADTGSAGITMNESRNHTSRHVTYQRLDWSVRVYIPRNTVTSAQLREVGTDRLLFTFPPTATGDEHAYSQSSSPADYAGDVPWNELYQLVGSGRTYLDVRSTRYPGGHLRGTVGPAPVGSWEGFVHSYCS